MARFAREHGGDPRFAVLPGVLHSEPVWGNGTTEFALDALLAAPHQQTKHGLPTSDAYVRTAIHIYTVFIQYLYSKWPPFQPISFQMHPFFANKLARKRPCNTQNITATAWFSRGWF